MSCIVVMKMNWYGFSGHSPLEPNKNRTMQNSSLHFLRHNGPKLKYSLSAKQKRVENRHIPQPKMSPTTFGRYSLIAFVLLAHLHQVFSQSQPKAINEICNSYNGRRIYMELGEHGVLQASNVVVPGNTNVNIQVNIGHFPPICVCFNLISCWNGEFHESTECKLNWTIFTWWGVWWRLKKKWDYAHTSTIFSNLHKFIILYL